MRLQRLRARRPEWQRRLLASLAAVGQQTPIVGVAVENQAALLGDRTLSTHRGFVTRAQKYSVKH